MNALNSATPESLRVPWPTTNIGSPVMKSSPYCCSCTRTFWGSSQEVKLMRAAVHGPAVHEVGCTRLALTVPIDIHEG